MNYLVTLHGAWVVKNARSVEDAMNIAVAEAGKALGTAPSAVHEIPEVVSTFSATGPTKTELITAVQKLPHYSVTFWIKNDEFIVYGDDTKASAIFVRYRGTIGNSVSNPGKFYYEFMVEAV